MRLARLIYFSENHVNPANGSVLRVLNDILAVSVRNNKAQGLTGALIFDHQWFMQVLEGRRESVWSTFERIRKDDRHSNLVLSELVDVDTRIFADWSMRLAARNAKSEAVFALYTRDGQFDPRRMNAAQMLSMFVALSSKGLFRDPAVGRAA